MKTKKGGGCKNKKNIKTKDKGCMILEGRRYLQVQIFAVKFCRKILPHEKIKVEDRNNRNLLLNLIVV